MILTMITKIGTASIMIFYALFVISQISPALTSIDILFCACGFVVGSFLVPLKQSLLKHENDFSIKQFFDVRRVATIFLSLAFASIGLFIIAYSAPSQMVELSAAAIGYAPDGVVKAWFKSKVKE